MSFGSPGSLCGSPPRIGGSTIMFAPEWADDPSVATVFVDDDDDVRDDPVHPLIGPSGINAVSINSPRDVSVVVVPPVKDEGREGSVLSACMYGLINVVIIAPVMISFTTIIFRDPVYRPYMPLLVKLVMFSAAVHQCSFASLSTLPFAIGQVQDAGLIFLSSMATATASALNGEDLNVVVATTLVTTALSTSLLGVALIITGQLRLASLVQYLPMPVVGGYLAYIGLYCMEAGLSLMSGQAITGFTEWPKLFHLKEFLFILPGIIGGIALLLATRYIRHFAVLPAGMLLIAVTFYIVVLALGLSFEEARAYGWMAPLPELEPFYQVWSLFEFGNVQWHTLPQQIPTWLGMFFVVAFSSSLDVAAIQMDMGTPLDYNHELKTVGASNLISGLTGGFTGSYIFSQTIFCMRAGVQSRANGLVVAVFEIVFFMAPFSVISYVPYLFFGSILCFIGIDLMLDWLIECRHKVLWTEYFVIWVTFIAINVVGLEAGMAIGVVVSALLFIFGYAKVRVAKQVVKNSGVVRTYHEREALASAHHTSIITLELRGNIFFGSSLQIITDVSRFVPTGREDVLTADEYSSLAADARRRYRQLTEESYVHEVPQFLVLDFAQVGGLDATAARSCFLPIRQQCAVQGVTVVYTSCSPDVEFLLRAHGALADSAQTVIFPLLSVGLEWCEEQLLNKAMRSMSPGSFPRGSKVRDLLMDYLKDHIKEDQLPALPAEEALVQYFERKELSGGDVLFEMGGRADEIFFLESGSMELFIPGGEGDDGPRTHTRLVQYNDGGIIGELDFYLLRERTISARAVSNASVWLLSRTAFRVMCYDDPLLATSVQTLILRSLCMSTSHVVLGT